MKNGLQQAIILATILVLHPLTSVQAIETDTRFSMTPTDDGFLRLDSKTGAVALCARSSNGWSCKPVEDDQLAVQEKLAALKKENRELKGEIEDLRRALDTQFADGTPSGKKKPGFQLPSDEDVDKLMSFLEKMARKFKGLVEELKENQEPGTPL